MEIIKIRLKGYRNITNTTIQFADLTTILGLNNYGKSNFLEGVEFASKFIKNSNKTKKKMMSHSGSLPINKVTAYNDFEFELEYLTKIKKETYQINYVFTFEWIQDGDRGCKIKGENLRIKETASSKYTSYIKRNYEKGFYKSSETGRSDTKIEIESNELIVNKLRTYDSLYYLEIIKELNSLKFDVVSFMDISKAFDGIKIGNVMSNDVFNLDFDDGFNINEVIYHLKDKYPDKYELLMDAFTSLIPSVESIAPIRIDFRSKVTSFDKVEERIPFKIPDEIYEIRIKERNNNQETSISHLSAGSKRVFFLLTSAILAEINKTSLITFEELENSIHPYLFQRLLIILTSITKNCKILITSHSPYVLQYLELENVYIGVPNPEGTACFRKMKKSARHNINKMALEHGIPVGDYIFDLLIESYTDNSVICSLLESGE